MKIVGDTRLPVALAAAVIIINSLGIALLQVRASRGCDTARSSPRNGASPSTSPPRTTGQYQGGAATTEAAAQMISPALMTLLIVSWGQSGWFILAALFAGSGLAALPTTRWAIRT